MVRCKSKTTDRLLLTGKIGPSLRELNHSDQSHNIEDQCPDGRLVTEEQDVWTWTCNLQSSNHKDSRKQKSLRL